MNRRKKRPSAASIDVPLLRQLRLSVGRRRRPKRRPKRNVVVRRKRW
jgi:hypothetical protein